MKTHNRATGSDVFIGQRDTSNDFVMGRDPNIVLRWADRPATAVMAYFLAFGWLGFIPGAAWMFSLLFTHGEPGVGLFGFLMGGFHLVIGFVLRKFVVLPLHAHLAYADAPKRSFPVSPPRPLPSSPLPSSPLPSSPLPSSPLPSSPLPPRTTYQKGQGY